MGALEKLGIPGKGAIDWDITPALTFTMFESWGSRARIRSVDERYYYFYIDSWQQPSKVCLMERGVKHARVLARVDAPQDMVDSCVAQQGKSISLDKSYAIDDNLKNWLTTQVLDTNDESKVESMVLGPELEDQQTGLPTALDPSSDSARVTLDTRPIGIVESDVPGIIKKHNFYEGKRNPQGHFANNLVDNNDGLTVTDLATGIMWQRGGIDITSVRTMNRRVNEVNQQGLAGYKDWRIPSMEEALSLLEPQVNNKGQHLHPCFSKAQPFIFVAGRHLPGGYWFTDFLQGTVFWASGFNPGGFGRLCRSI